MPPLRFGICLIVPACRRQAIWYEIARSAISTTTPHSSFLTPPSSLLTYDFPLLSLFSLFLTHLIPSRKSLMEPLNRPV